MIYRTYIMYSYLLKMRRLASLLCNDIRCCCWQHIFKLLVILTLLVVHQLLMRLEDLQLQSTCSFTADQRGFNQSVVAYSLYGPYSTDPDTFSRYVSPIKENVARIKQVYKGTESFFFILLE